MGTPITIFIMWSVLYIFSQVSSLLMLYPLANLANLLMWGLTFLGATWAYAKYSGEFSGVGVQIEELTGKVWDNCFQPILSKAAEQGGAFCCFISNGFEKEPLTIAKTRLAFIGCYYQ